MTVGEAISRVDRLKYNAFSLEEKQRWLGQLEAMLKSHILDTHAPGLSYTPIDANSPAATPLLAPEPYDAMYVHWLEAQMDLYTGELPRYNATILLFNTQYGAFESWYNRHFAPLDRGTWRC